MFITDEIRKHRGADHDARICPPVREGTRVVSFIRAWVAAGVDSDALYTLFITDQEGRLLGTLEMRARCWLRRATRP